MAGEREEQLAQGIGSLLGSVSLDGGVENLRRLSGGASRETWSFDLVSGEVQRSLILQRLRPGTVSGGPGMVGEAALIRAAGAAGVPVPRVVAADAGEALGAPCMVMDRLEGETIARKLLRDEEWATARSRLVTQAGEALAAIHGIAIDAAPSLRSGDQLDEMRSLLHSFAEPHPALELGVHWLERNRPPDVPAQVVHGDFRLGNLLLDHEGLAGVLDWELAHLGDPAEDLGWFCVRAWRFGSRLPAGGMGTRQELLSAYQAAGGRPIDEEALRWWEALGTLKWALICVVQSQAHLSGAVRSVELATIGRRVCESEWDLLRLLPGGELPGDTTASSADTRSLHGRPTAEELVEAVREWLESDVKGSATGRLGFDARVATNALRIVERELALGPAQQAAHALRLAELGSADDAELARRIRAGELDTRGEEVRQAVARSVRAKLEVSNPRWLEPD